MPRRTILPTLAVLAGLLLAPAASTPAGARSVESARPWDNADAGLWKTEDGRYVVAVAPCNGSLCGAIRWFAPGVPAFDVKNPDPARQHRPLCGLNLLQGFRQADALTWTGGTVYRTETGETFNATISMVSPGKVVVRAYVLVPALGRSQTLTPAAADDHPPCRAPAAPATGRYSQK